MSDFNDREWKVEAALQLVHFHAIHHELGLSLASIRVLDQLRYGKIDLRRAVQSEVNFYGQERASPNKARARKLIAAIENLNAEIEEVDGVVDGARGGPARKKPPAKKKPAGKKKAATKKNAAAKK